MASDIDLPESDRVGDLPHPRTRADLFGHGAAEALFLESFRIRRTAHAWILAGPRGIGKATLAYRMARFALRDPVSDSVPYSLDLPPSDPVFQRVASLGHANLAILRRSWDSERKRLKTVITVDEVRRMAALFGKSAAEGGWRVCILDSAEDLNTNAANALLKLLEEPPEKALFLIVSHRPGLLSATIRSRCRLLPLRVVADDVVARLVDTHFPNLAHADRLALVRLAEGSPGRALGLASAGGLEFYRAMVGLIEPLPRLDVPALHGFGDQIARGGEDTLRLVLELLAGWLARMVRNAAMDAPADDVTPGEGEAMRRFTARGSLDRWIELWDKVNDTLAEAEAVNLDRKQVVLNVFNSLQAAAQG